MLWTNVFKLPEPLAQLISEDLYREERQKQLISYCSKHLLDAKQIKHFSASDLIRPPRMRVLASRHNDQIATDVSAHIYRILGTAIHTSLRLAGKRMTERGCTGYIPEERLFTSLEFNGQTVVISGEPDLITPDNWIHDYKITSVGSLDKGVKLEWEQACNIYAHLRLKNGTETKGILITFILRDWLQSHTVQHGYPAVGAQTMGATLWEATKTEDFIKERLRLHLEAEECDDDKLLECTPEEMWEKPEAWAVIRENANRAVKLYKAESFPDKTDSETIMLAANADAHHRNAKLKKDEAPYVVLHRPGERTRCKFCDAKSFCNTYKEYTSAAFAAKIKAKGE
jgi:hypothetical protein